MIEVVVDSREDKLKTAMTKLGYSFVVEQLPAGDVVFRDAASKNIVLVCERKTMPDMYSSVLSDRYRDQRERLEQSGCKICYILEGFRLSFSPAESKRSTMLRGAIENLALYHPAISVILTASVGDTARSVESVRKKLEKRTPADVGSASSPVQTSFLPSKKSKISKNMFQNQLELINGVSPVIARKVVETYKDFCSLFAAYNAKTSENEKEKMLVDLVVGKRRIGPVLSKRVYETFFKKRENSSE